MLKRLELTTKNGTIGTSHLPYFSQAGKLHFAKNKQHCDGMTALVKISHEVIGIHINDLRTEQCVANPYVEP